MCVSYLTQEGKHACRMSRARGNARVLSRLEERHTGQGKARVAGPSSCFFFRDWAVVKIHTVSIMALDG